MLEMAAAGQSHSQIARKLGVAKSTVWKALHRAGPGGKAVAPAAKKAGRSLAEFRQTYDKDTIIPGKVRAALREIGSGWEYEVQFAKLAGVSLADLSAYRDQFADYVVTLRESRRAWAGTVATAKAMKEML
jgi:transcriptional regulator with XRE-family HTH domain